MRAPAATALAEPVALGLGRLLVLGHRLGRPAGPRPLLGDPVAVVDVGHEPRAALHEEGDALVVDERAVLHRADPAADRELDPLGAVGVGRDEHPERGRLVDGRLDHRRVHLHDARARAAGQDRAGHEDLDQVRPAADDRPNALADLGRVAHDPEPQVVRQDDVRGQARDVAGAAWAS